MAITNISQVTGATTTPGSPIFLDIVELDLDASYPAGGYTEFTSTLASTIGEGRTLLGVVQLNFPIAVHVQYNKATDKLQCYTEALVEHSGSDNLSSATDLRLLVISI